MAYSVDYVKEIGEGRGGSRPFNGLGDSSRTFEIKLAGTQTRSDYTDNHAIFESGIPAYREAHPTRAFIYCTNKSAQSMNRNGTLWQVKCDYSWVDPAENPWDRIPIWSGGGQKFELPVDVISSIGNVDDSGDAGKPIINTAGQPYDPGLTRTFTFPVVTAQFNVQAFSTVANYLLFQDSLNSGTFWGYSAGKVKLDDVTWQQVREEISGSLVVYYSVTLKFVINVLQSWQPYVMNAGYFEKVSGSLRQILINGQPPSQPWPLDSDGKMLPQDGSGDIIFKRYDVQPMRDFSGFPSNITSGPP